MINIRARAKAKEPTKNFTVVLAGNPNAGKTTLFNSLTKSSLRTGNFHGVTTAPASKTRGGITYIDVPGIRSTPTRWRRTAQPRRAKPPI